MSERYFDVAVSQEDRATVVAVDGEMDLFASPALAEALRRALDRPAPIVVDLSGCSLFESSALNALLAAQTAAQRDGRSIHVARPPAGCAERTLALTLPGFFVEHDTRDDALASVA